MRRKIRIAGFALVWSGVLTLGIVAYQLFVTDLLNDRVQATARVQLEAALEERRDTLALPVTVTTPPDLGGTTSTTTVVEPIDFHPEADLPEGDPLGIIRIPDIDLERVLFSGVTPPTLREGPGHMLGTPVPGQPGNAVISGHRTTYGAPFFDLDRLAPGAVIEVETAVGIHRYTVRETLVVAPTDVWVADPIPGAWLTLTTCNPKFSASQRLVVRAELTSGPNVDYARYLRETQYSDVS